MSPKKQGRQSGIELLRILTIMGVVLLHYNNGWGLKAVPPGSSQQLLYFLESLCICAVDLFVLISGYFLSGTQRRSLLKPLELLIQVIAFEVGIYLVLVIISGSHLSVSYFLECLVPDNYFVILYTAVYLVSPYLNRLFATFDTREWNRFLLTAMLLFSVYPTAVDLFEELTQVQWPGLSTISAFGGQQGFTVVNFLLLYSVGAYLRHNSLPKWLEGKGRQLTVFLLSVAVLFPWALATENLRRFELRSAWIYHNPLVILTAAALFSLFRSFRFQSRVINELSGAGFTCFLFHGYLLEYFRIEEALTKGTVYLLFHILFTAAACYLVSYAAYKVYSLATGWFFRWLEKHCGFLQSNTPLHIK